MIGRWRGTGKACRRCRGSVVWSDLGMCLARHKDWDRAIDALRHAADPTRRIAVSEPARLLPGPGRTNGRGPDVFRGAAARAGALQYGPHAVPHEPRRRGAPHLQAAAQAGPPFSRPARCWPSWRPASRPTRPCFKPGSTRRLSPAQVAPPEERETCQWRPPEGVTCQPPVTENGGQRPPNPFRRAPLPSFARRGKSRVCRGWDGGRGSGINLVSIFCSGEVRPSFTGPGFGSGSRARTVRCRWAPGPRPERNFCRYHLNHSRGLICHSLSIARLPKSIAARRPLHRAPEP